MNKVPMRPRQIDFNKPLAILREDRDINVTTSDFFTVPKGGINTTTGMEKEEESEHHLQQILNSSCQQRSATIPVPEVIEDLAEFEATYAGGFKLSSHFITHQTLEPSDEKEIDYDMDSADEAWLSSSDSSISTEIFETLMDCFEKACGKKVPLLKEALSLVKACTSIGTEAAIAVYDYWLEKRSFQPEGFLYVVNDGQEPVGNADPYVAFRRRSEKMQTRRHRRSDELSYEKMFLFHQSLLHLKSLTYDIYLRDSAKKLQAEKSYEIDQLRLKCPDITSDVYKKCLRDASTVQVDSKAFFKSLRQRPENEERLKCKRQDNTTALKELDSSVSENEFEFMRMEGVQYERCRTDFLQKTTLENIHPSGHKYFFCDVPNACHNVNNHWSGYVRPRIGRLGRRILDRSVHLNTSDSSYETPNKIVRLQIPFSQYQIRYKLENGDLIVPSTTQISSHHPSIFYGHVIPILTPNCSGLNFISQDSIASNPHSAVNAPISSPASTLPSDGIPCYPLHQTLCMKPGSANGSDSGMGSAPSTPPAGICSAPSANQPCEVSEQIVNESRKRFIRPSNVGCRGKRLGIPNTFSGRTIDAFKFHSDSKPPQTFYSSSSLPLSHYHSLAKSWNPNCPPIHVLHE